MSEITPGASPPRLIRARKNEETVMNRSIVSTLCLTLLLIISFSDSADASDLKAANAWVNMPILDEAPPAYFVIQNRGTSVRKIVGGTCTGCQSIEIHRAVLKDGAMVSEVLPEWEIPAGGAVAFAPRGIFLALVGVKDLNEGDKISISIELEDGEKVEFDADVREE
jgi:periplasmic copper chaperone A